MGYVGIRPALCSNQPLYGLTAPNQIGGVGIRPALCSNQPLYGLIAAPQEDSVDMRPALCINWPLNALTASHETSFVDTCPSTRPTIRPFMVLQQHTRVGFVDTHTSRHYMVLYAVPQPDLACSHRTKGIRFGTNIWQKHKISCRM